MGAPNDPGFYRTLLDNLLEGVYFVDRDRRISYWNEGAKHIAGYSADEVVGHHCYDDLLVHTDEQGHPLCQTPDCPATRVMDDGVAREELVYLRHRDGYRVPVFTRISPIHDDKGEVIGAVELFSDASKVIEERRRVQELQQQALMDSLTGVGNRRFGEIGLRDRLGSFDRYGLGFAVMIVDVDYFKSINDQHGHPAGDAALRMVATTLRNCLRSSDVVARWGGDEFLVILTGFPGCELQRQADRMRRLIEESRVDVGTGSVKVTVSMGAVSVPPVGSPEQLVERADELLYEAKQSGRNRVNTTCSIE